MKRWIMFGVMSLTLTFTTLVIFNAVRAATAESPVRVEMRLLDRAFKNLIDSLLLNNPKGIEAPFHEVHKAKMNTEKALEKGEIRLPKNHDKIKEFIEMDEQFHNDTDELIKASRKGDMKAIQAVTHRLLDGCVRCHQQFRN